MSYFLTSAPHPEPSPHYIGRFAPSPTGPLHFGSLLAALGSYLQARCARGQWLLRIEDVDQPRVVRGAADHIITTLAAFGFEWSGAIEYQSLRQHHYAAALDRLRSQQLAYRCTCSRSQIAAATAQDSVASDELRYPGTCRQRTDTQAGPAAIRFIAADDAVRFIDRIQGAQEQDVAAVSGDLIVQRRDGLFAYHLAVVVDDAAQGITEVTRGADLLSSTSRQILLQRALGLSTPNYCHLPLAVDSAGRKLSKSSQSQAIDPAHANTIIWRALAALCQAPPGELRAAPLREIWEWAQGNWSLAPLANQRTCPAPPP